MVSGDVVSDIPEEENDRESEIGDLISEHVLHSEEVIESVECVDDHSMMRLSSQFHKEMMVPEEFFYNGVEDVEDYKENCEIKWVELDGDFDFRTEIEEDGLLVEC